LIVEGSRYARSCLAGYSTTEGWGGFESRRARTSTIETLIVEGSRYARSCLAGYSTTEGWGDLAGYSTTEGGVEARRSHLNRERWCRVD
jgi:hypothetical protein